MQYFGNTSNPCLSQCPTKLLYYRKRRFDQIAQYFGKIEEDTDAINA